MSFLDGIDMTHINSEVEKWKKRTKKKGPFYLYKTSIANESWRNGPNIYTVIWYERNKTKIGSFYDGMYCRYGISTYGTLTGATMSGFWQASSGVLDDNEMTTMLNFAKGERTLLEFDIETIKNLRW